MLLCNQCRYWRNGKYEGAEVLFPGVFSSNGRPPIMGSSACLQYLQHSTHSPEEGNIWDGEYARLKGNAKQAGLYIPFDNNSVLVTTWERNLRETQLQQLCIDECHDCREIGHQCSGCCTSSSMWISPLENHYAQLARLTCKPTGSTCSGEECKKVEKVLPGSYVWFGVPDSKEDTPQQVVGKQEETEEEKFKRQWKLESRYGMRSFVVNIHKLLQAYQESIGNGQASDEVCHRHGNITHQVVLLCGGTFFYRKEICYAVIVTYKSDGVHDGFLPVNNPRTDDATTPRCDWSSILDEDGCYAMKGGCPMFTPNHNKGEFCKHWDHVVFAFHLPDGKELCISKEALVGGRPLYTVHNTPDTKCHKFRRFGKKAAEKCAENEEYYADAQ